MSVQFQSENLLFSEHLTSGIPTSDRRSYSPTEVAFQPPQSLRWKLTNHLYSHRRHIKQYADRCFVLLQNHTDPTWHQGMTINCLPCQLHTSRPNLESSCSDAKGTAMERGNKASLPHFSTIGNTLFSGLWISGCVVLNAVLQSGSLLRSWN